MIFTLLTIENLGSLVAVLGSIVSLFGVYLFNIKDDPDSANEVWVVSNLLLLIWACGYRAHLWSDGLSADALVVTYSSFFVASIYRKLRKERRRKIIRDVPA